jgi:putative transcriptional regulator
MIIKLREIRKERNLTQEELAGRAGVSRQTIISIENGSYLPSLMLAFNLAKILEVSIIDLCIYE